eukprot:3394476-Amphidinium_carterae.1
MLAERCAAPGRFGLRVAFARFLGLALAWASCVWRCIRSARCPGGFFAVCKAPLGLHRPGSLAQTAGLQWLLSP